MWKKCSRFYLKACRWRLSTCKTLNWTNWSTVRTLINRILLHLHNHIRHIIIRNTKTELHTQNPSVIRSKFYIKQHFGSLIFIFFKEEKKLFRSFYVQQCKNKKKHFQVKYSVVSDLFLKHSDIYCKIEKNITSCCHLTSVFVSENW